MKLDNYLQDGANYQARAVLCLLQGLCWFMEEDENIFNSLRVGRWENCREQGYVVMLVVNDKQLNIAFFEHRNSDSIHAVKWEDRTFGDTPTVNTAKFENSDIYKDKFDTSYSTTWKAVGEMATWIADELKEFHDENYQVPKTVEKA